MNVEIACTLLSRLRGLLGREPHGAALLLVPCNDVHTFGMSRAIDVAFIASDGMVLESHRNVTPNRRVRNRRAASTIERFACGEAWCEPGDRAQLVLRLERTSEADGENGNEKGRTR